MDPVYASYSAARWCAQHGLRPLAYVIRGAMRVVFACDVPYGTRIGKGTLFPHHALGVVIHPAAVIGEGCRISQNVTIGGRKEIDILPVIGDRVTLGCGSMVLGPVAIGDDAMIGAGAVVISDVPSGATAVGVPAKVLGAATKDAR